MRTIANTCVGGDAEGPRLTHFRQAMNNIKCVTTIQQQRPYWLAQTESYRAMSSV